MNEKRYSFKQLMALAVSVSIIIPAAETSAIWTAKGVDIVRTPERLTNDELKDNNFQTNVISRLENLDWEISNLRTEIEGQPTTKTKDQYK